MQIMRLRMTSGGDAWLWAAALAAAALASACSDSSNGGDDIVPTAASCTRDKSLLATARSCALDEDCPCGAHCALGICKSDCESASDCPASAACDDFGRCADASGASSATAAQGILVATPTTVEFLAASDVRVISLAARAHDLGEARVVAPAGLEVRCAVADDFATSCMVPALTTAGGVLNVEVRLARDLPTARDEYAELSLYAGSQRQAVGVRLVSARRVPLDRPSGVYRGFAQIVGAGLSSRPGVDHFPDELSGILVPVTVTVYPGSMGSHVIALDDAYDAIMPGDSALGHLFLDGNGAWQLATVAQHSLGALASRPDDPDLAVRLRAEEVSWHEEVLRATVRAVYEGATLDAQAPFVRWELGVRYVEPLPTGTQAPALPAPYARVVSTAARAANPIALESLALEALPPSLGNTASARATAAMCTQKGMTSAVHGLQGALLRINERDAASGDLACASDDPTPTTPQRTFPGLALDQFAANALVATCLDDLAAADSIRNGGAAAVLAPAGCVDVARVATALALALATDRQRALGLAYAPEAQGTAVGHRLMQQWLSLAGFVGREAFAVQRLNSILDAAAQVDAPYTPTEALATGVAAFDLLLHPRIAAALPLMHPTVIANPDYRTRLFPDLEVTQSRSYEQPVGLPVALIATVRAQLGVFNDLVSEARAGRLNAAELPPLEKALWARLPVVLGLASGLYELGRSTGELDWEPEWQLSLTALGSMLRTVQDNLTALARHTNPLGIEDIDLPLYRVGDETSALARFSSLSDYLLGTGTSLLAVAPALVARARSALDDARDAWVLNLQRDYTVQLEAAERSRRLEGINRRYGEQIGSLCGDPTWSADTVLTLWDTIDPDTCFVAPECRPSAAEVRARMTTADLGYALCLTHELRRRYGPNVLSRDRAFNSAADALGPTLGAGKVFPIRITSIDSEQVTVHSDVSGADWYLAKSALAGASVHVPDDLSGEYVREAQQICQAGRLATQAARPVLPPAACTLTDQCPVGTLCTADATCEADLGTELDAARCYRGSLGEMAVSVRAAARDIQIQRAQLESLTKSYDIAMRSCEIAYLAHEQMEEATRKHNDTMMALGEVKLVADIAVAAASAAQDSFNIGNEILSGGGVGASAVAKAVAQSVSASMGLAMDEAELEHEALMQELEHDMEEKTCTNDAALHLVGVKAAALAVERATIELSRQLIELENLKLSLRCLLAEGHTAVAYEKERRVAPVATNFWIDEKVQRYEDYLRQARRAVYLAVLAVEYEYQVSSAERSATLAAQTPAELERVIDRLLAYTLTGTVAGASPSVLFSVVSVRDHLLQLADRSGFPDGWYQLDQQQRFSLSLTSPVHAVYDRNGAYLGQELSFSLYPLGTDGIGQVNGIPILAGTDCAERLWSVNASLIGNDLYNGSDTTMTRVVLRKRNTFFSQWCGGREGEPFQVATTRPSRNLFLDPYDRKDSLTTATPVPNTTGDETRSYSNARISAYLNVNRATLEDEQYFNGDSQELAGRGLYGDYALFFPAEVLSDGTGDGLVLGNVEDVLLRFDYVSVARSSR